MGAVIPARGGPHDVGERTHPRQRLCEGVPREPTASGSRRCASSRRPGCGHAPSAPSSSRWPRACPATVANPAGDTSRRFGLLIRHGSRCAARACGGLVGRRWCPRFRTLAPSKSAGFLETPPLATGRIQVGQRAPSPCALNEVARLVMSTGPCQMSIVCAVLPRPSKRQVVVGSSRRGPSATLICGEGQAQAARAPERRGGSGRGLPSRAQGLFEARVDGPCICVIIAARTRSYSASSRGEGSWRGACEEAAAASFAGSTWRHDELCDGAGLPVPREWRARRQRDSWC